MKAQHILLSRKLELRSMKISKFKRLGYFVDASVP